MVRKSKSPEWEKSVEKVIVCQEQGLPPSQIIALTGIDAKDVNKIIRDEDVARATAKKNFEDRLPLIKDIVGLGLEQINQTLREMSSDPGYRAAMITSLRDLSCLTKVISELNILLRLDQGQSTENLSQHSYSETRQILEEFRTTDRVFDLPSLPAPREKPPEGEL